MNDITVCIATIPPRAKKLRQALGSVVVQTLQPAAIVVEYDHDRTGAAATKNRALAKADTEWVAFLDDDDLFLPHHLEALHAAAQRENADVVYSIPEVPQRPDKRDPDGRYGVPFDAAELRRRSYIQTTSLVRTKLFQETGGFQTPPGCDYDDWGAWLALLDRGAHFVHHPEVTFIWNHWGFGTAGQPGNTSGRPDRW
jgi:glycosyltransferase involved in cell wall biosynthesis